MKRRRPSARALIASGAKLCAPIVLGFALLFTAVPLGAEEHPPAEAIPPGFVDSLKPGSPVDDRRMLAWLTERGAALIREGRTLTNWQGQLESRKTPFSLARPYRKHLTPAELSRTSEPGVVVVGICYLCPSCGRTHANAASGFVIHRSGAIVTSRHVFAQSPTNALGACVMTRDGRVWPVRGILAADAANDLVVLRAEGEGFVPLPVATREPVVGSPVTVISHPKNLFYMVTTGTVARHALESTAAGTVRRLNITADFAKGSSGAPVLDDQGNVVGIVASTRSIYYDEEPGKRDNLQMVVHNCIPAAALRELVKDVPPRRLNRSVRP